MLRSWQKKRQKHPEWYQLKRLTKHGIRSVTTPFFKHFLPCMEVVVSMSSSKMVLISCQLFIQAYLSLCSDNDQSCRWHLTHPTPIVGNLITQPAICWRAYKSTLPLPLMCILQSCGRTALISEYFHNLNPLCTREQVYFRPQWCLVLKIIFLIYQSFEIYRGVGILVWIAQSIEPFCELFHQFSFQLLSTKEIVPIKRF